MTKRDKEPIRDGSTYNFLSLIKNNCWGFKDLVLHFYYKNKE